MDISSYSDQKIVEALLARDCAVTKAFFYEKCYPLFKATFLKYETGCESCLEFINEIYVHILMKGTQSHRSKLEGFGFKCSLIYWIKIVTENYCHQLFKKKMDIFEENFDAGDRKMSQSSSIGMELNSISRYDLETMLAQMPNARYRMIIFHRYVEDKTNEETALLLNMTMDNFYNKHRLAKEQFRQILRKEGLI